MKQLAVYLLCLFVLMLVDNTLQLATPDISTKKPETWTGRWLPEHLQDVKHGIKMGISSVHCDDAKTNLTVDWDNSPINYTCYHPAHKYSPSWAIKPVIEYENIPKYYAAKHECMNSPITYEETIPTFGTHRPLWPKYGEYKFVPVQRWLHTLEHGGIVMLYHPCANSVVVNQLRHLVTSCLRRHVITPYNLLDSRRPLVLVAWGVRLKMSTVQDHIVKAFITKHALKGPEQVPTEGQYDDQLLKLANIVSDFNDSELCPLTTI